MPIATARLSAKMDTLANSEIARSDARVGRSSVLRTWLNWTGIAVCGSGIVPPSRSSGALGEPGLRSM